MTIEHGVIVGLACAYVILLVARWRDLQKIEGMMLAMLTMRETSDYHYDRLLAAALELARIHDAARARELQRLARARKGEFGPS